MAWRDSIRRPHAQVRIFSDLTLSTRIATYGGGRILSIDVTEETPCIALKRRVSECTVRVTNDLATNAYGQRVPSLGAEGVESGTYAVGNVLRTCIWEGGTTDERWTSTFVIDGIEATDDSATIHGLGVESLLDKTFDEAGLSTTIDRPYAMTWMLDAMAACGLDRSSVLYPAGYNKRLPRAYEVDGSTPVGDVVRGIAAFKGLTVGATDTGYRGAILPTGWELVCYEDDEGNMVPLPLTSFAEPTQNETYGTLVIVDPTDGTSQEMGLLNDQDGELEVTVPFSSDLAEGGDAWNSIKFSCGDRLSPWSRADLAGDPYLVHANMYDSTLGRLDQPNVMVMRSSGMYPYRIEHRFDGGYRQTIYGPMQ